jgi:hypothetical protein
MDDLPHQEKLKRENHHTIQVKDEDIVDIIHSHKVSNNIQYTVEKQEKREIFKIPFGRWLKKNRKARQEGND